MLVCYWHCDELFSIFYTQSSSSMINIFLKFQAITQRQQRAPESSYVRFGKRAPEGLTYSGCVAYTLARATNRSDLLRMLVQNGCVKDKRLLHYAKKDGYIR